MKTRLEMKVPRKGNFSVESDPNKENKKITANGTELKGNKIQTFAKYCVQRVGALLNALKLTKS